MIGEAYLARVRELLPQALARALSAHAAGRHLDRAHRLSRHADPADRDGPAELARDRRQPRPRRRPQAGDGDEPRRQQRRHEPGRAGSARAARHAGGHHQLVALRRAGRTVHRRRKSAMACMAARSRPRSCWPPGPIRCARTRSPTSRRRASRWSATSNGSARTGRRRLHGPRRICIRAARSAMRRRPSAEKGRALLDHGARAFCELLADVEKFDLKQFGNQ